MEHRAGGNKDYGSAWGLLRGHFKACWRRKQGITACRAPTRVPKS